MNKNLFCFLAAIIVACSVECLASKKLVSMMDESGEYGFRNVYDMQGRLTAMKIPDGCELRSGLLEYYLDWTNYDNGNVKFTVAEYSEMINDFLLYDFTVTLDANKKAIELHGYDISEKYSYDNQSHLVEVDHRDGDYRVSAKLDWTGNNISSIISDSNVPSDRDQISIKYYDNDDMSGYLASLLCLSATEAGYMATVLAEAGLMGTACTKMPRYFYSSMYYRAWYYRYEFDTDGYVVKYLESEDEDFSSASGFLLTWSSGQNKIDDIESDDIVSTEVYSIDGIINNHPQRGINILKRRDGKITKVMVK